MMAQQGMTGRQGRICWAFSRCIIANHFMPHTDLYESKPRNYPVGSFRMGHDPISRSCCCLLDICGAWFRGNPKPWGHMSNHRIRLVLCVSYNWFLHRVYGNEHVTCAVSFDSFWPRNSQHHQGDKYINQTWGGRGRIFIFMWCQLFLPHTYTAFQHKYEIIWVCSSKNRKFHNNDLYVSFLFFVGMISFSIINVKKVNS